MIAGYILIGLFGVAGNSFAIFVLARSESMRKKLVNVYLINKSVIDLVASVLLILIGYYKNNSTVKTFSGTSAHFFCRIIATRYPLWAMFASSTWNLVLVNFERYLSIAYPIFHKISITKTHITVSIAVVWLIGPIGKGIIVQLGSGYKDGMCRSYSLWPSKLHALVGSAVNVAFHYFLPLILMTFCYLLMIRILKVKASVGAVNQIVVSRNISHNSKSRNILKTLAIVTVVFILCWTINNVMFVMFLTGYLKRLDGTFYHFSVHLVFLNCCLNPLVYSAQYEDFQRQIIRVFCPGKLTEQAKEVSITASANG